MLRPFVILVSMKRTIILSLVVGLIAIFNGWIANTISPAFRLPDSVAEDVVNKIDSLDNDLNPQVTIEDKALVKRVIDGDTIEVEFSGGELALVRYIGVDTPERERETTPAECFYNEAAKRNAELVEGHEVRLVKDVSETDQYGRLLRYVYVGDDLINLRLLREGYARPVTFPPDVARVEEFKVAAEQARLGGVGLWSVCR